MLHFHLAGINNQNFIMRDEETGSWWQQVTGEAILGPMKGTRLKPVSQDEVSFAIWRAEQPRGRVLRPSGHLDDADWESQIAKLPTVTPLVDRRLAARDVVIGIVIDGVAKAYSREKIVAQSPVIDTLGRTPIVIVAAGDKRSIRAFSRVVDGRTLELFAASDLVDKETGSHWDFSGLATSGPLAGKRLQKIDFLTDYWFDWKTYHPTTLV